MKFLNILLALSTSFIFLYGCTDNLNCTKGNGIIQTEERKVPSFNTLEIVGSMEVEIIQDSIQSLMIEADENILPLIESRVISNRLIIEMEGCISNHSPVKVWISNPEIRGVYSEGASSVSSPDTIVEESFTISIDGSGSADLNLIVDEVDSRIEGSADIHLTGTSVNQDIEIIGSGNIFAMDMNSDIVDVNILGSGNVWVTCQNTLYVDIDGSGTVYYKGFPDIHSNIVGSGVIIDEN